MNLAVMRSAVAVVIVMLGFGPGPGPALAQDERPDLQIEVVGLEDTVDSRDVKIRVTNISKNWSHHTTATVETVSPAPANKVEIDVLDLDPKQNPQGPTDYKFEFTYKLAAPCDGHVVKANLSAGTNYAGVKENKLGNNQAEKKLCEQWSKPAPKPNEPIVQAVDPNTTVVKPGTRRGAAEAILGNESSNPAVDPNTAVVKPGGTRPGAVEAILGPEHTRPGVHGDGGRWPALVLEPSAVSVAVRKQTGGACPPFSPSSDGLLVVGWSQQEETGGWCTLGIPAQHYRAEVAQTAINFNFRMLDEVPSKTIKKAVLTFNEKPFEWRSGGGAFEQKGGCVEVLGRATAEWEGRQIEGLFPNEAVQGHTPGAREWWLTGEVEQWLNNSKPRLGFVLRGGNEGPQGDDDTSCMSEISGLKLTIEYIVPE